MHRETDVTVCIERQRERCMQRDREMYAERQTEREREREISAEMRESNTHIHTLLHSLSLSVCEEMDSSLGVCSWRLADCIEAC